MKIVLMLEDDDVIQAGDEVRNLPDNSQYDEESTYLVFNKYNDRLKFQSVEIAIPYYIGKTLAEYRSRPSDIQIEVVRRVDSIDMVIFCPECGAKHVDKEEIACDKTSSLAIGLVCGQLMEHPGNCIPASPIMVEDARWKNPPHKSHLCRACGSVFRVADVETNGVEEVSRGTADTWPNEKLRLEFAISFHTGGIGIPNELMALVHKLTTENDHVEVKGSAVVICTKSWPPGRGSVVLTDISDEPVKRLYGCRECGSIEYCAKHKEGCRTCNCGWNYCKPGCHCVCHD